MSRLYEAIEDETRRAFIGQDAVLWEKLVRDSGAKPG